MVDAFLVGILTLKKKLEFSVLGVGEKERNQCENVESCALIFCFL